MKKFGAKMGYIIGITLVIPLIIFIANAFFLKGNNLGEEQIDTYIRDTETITIDVPKDALQENIQFTPKLKRRNSYAFLKKITFYSETYQKYFTLVIFIYFEKNDDVRMKTILYKDIKITARVNKKQLVSPQYGTEQKPIPIFPLDLLETKGQKAHPDNQRFFHLSEPMYRVYVQQYLNRFTSKDDIEELFR